MTDGAPPNSADGLAAALVQRLTARGWTVAAAESLTGGLVMATLIGVPGASACVRGGVVAYATPLKHSLLGVDAALLAAEGAVHPEVARQMAEGVRTAASVHDVIADVGIATTGVAGPAAQDGRPVGTVFVAVATPAETHVEELSLSGPRPQIRAGAAHGALALALRATA